MSAHSRPPQVNLPQDGYDPTFRSGDRGTVAMRVIPALRFFICALVFLAGCSPSGRTAVVDVGSARGISVGTPVRFRGTDIGRVRSITSGREAVRLELFIDREDAPIRAADRVILRSDGILGARFVDIEPGPNTAPLIGNRSTLTAAPPDSVDAVRDAIARAMAKELLAPLLRRDSSSSSTKAPPASRP